MLSPAAPLLSPGNQTDQTVADLIQGSVWIHSKHWFLGMTALISAIGKVSCAGRGVVVSLILTLQIRGLVGQISASLGNLTFQFVPFSFSVMSSEIHFFNLFSLIIFVSLVL
jgi:hypothetical protein